MFAATQSDAEHGVCNETTEQLVLVALNGYLMDSVSRGLFPLDKGKQ